VVIVDTAIAVLIIGNIQLVAVITVGTVSCSDRDLVQLVAVFILDTVACCAHDWYHVVSCSDHGWYSYFQ